MIVSYPAMEHKKALFLLFSCDLTKEILLLKTQMERQPGREGIQKSILRRFSGMELNIICTTVSAEVMLSFRTHSCVTPTAPMLVLRSNGFEQFSGSLFCFQLCFWRTMDTSQ